MKHMCVSCNYIYDESMWDEDEGIPFATKIENIEKCPVCEESDSFQWIIEEVNYAEDENYRQFIERDHVPDLHIEGNILEVCVGIKAHPMEVEHRITSIALYDEYGDLIQEEFLNQNDSPSKEFDISEFDDFEVRASCNIHGVWGKKYSK